MINYVRSDYCRKHFHKVTDVPAFVAETLKALPKRIGVDTETFYNPDNEAAVIRFIMGSKNNEPFGYSFFYGELGYWVDSDFEALAPLLQHPDIEKVFHNRKYDQHMSSNVGVDIKHKLHDTVNMIHLIDEEHICTMYDGTKKKSKALKNLAEHYKLAPKDYELDSLVDLARQEIAREKVIPKADVSYKDVYVKYPELMIDYAIYDTKFCYELSYLLESEMDKQELWQAYNCDSEALDAVFEIERIGVKVDTAAIDRDAELLRTIISDYEDSLLNLAGRVFNANSPHDFLDVVYERFGIKWEWFNDETNTADWGKDRLRFVAELEKERNPESMFPTFVEHLLNYRRAHHMLSTYVEGVLAFVQNGRVHASFNINPNDRDVGATKTGRMSANNPNLQNQPKKPIKIVARDVDPTTGEPMVYEISPRKYFVPDDGFRWGLMDYDQQEYRVLGHYGRDRAFMRFIEEGLDIHKAAYADMFNKPYDEVTDEERTGMKRLNFGLVYQLGLLNFAISLGHNIDRDMFKKAQQFLFAIWKPWELFPWAQGGRKRTVDQQYVDAQTRIAQIDDPDERAGIAEAVDYFFHPDTLAMIADAFKIKNDYLAKYEGNSDFLKQAKKVAKERGYVKTWKGRRRHFKDPAQENYKAPNAIIQGTCSVILKDRLAAVQKFLEDKKSYVAVLIHDEFGFMIHESERSIIPAIMEILQDLPFRVPLTVGFEYGDNLHERRAPEDLKEYCYV